LLRDVAAAQIFGHELGRLCAHKGVAVIDRRTVIRPPHVRSLKLALPAGGIPVRLDGVTDGHFVDKGDSYDVAASKVLAREKEARAAMKPKPLPEDTDDDQDDASSKVARLVAKGFKPDEAHTAVHRQERLRKFGF
jgi:hypothetical protein